MMNKFDKPNFNRASNFSNYNFSEFLATIDQIQFL